MYSSSITPCYVSIPGKPIYTVMLQLPSSTIPTFQYHPFLVASIMDQGNEVSNLCVTITSENVAITFDGTTGYVAGSTIEHSLTIVATERVQSVQDTGGYLSGPMPYNGGVKIEELIPFDFGYNYGPVGDTGHSSGFEERHRSLLVANKELSILVGDLRREGEEIDRLVGENRDLRAHIGSLEFEITRLRREFRGGYY
ncbi:hypothetical protein Tco_1317612 [Tanacetum coccineum]